MCSPVFCEDGQITEEYCLHPNMYVKTMVDNIDEIYDIMEGNFSAMQSTMGCIWPEKTLKRLIDERKVNAGSCQMSRESGIIFKPNAELIACNALYGYPLGKFGNEFNDAKSFLEFRRSPSVANFFRKIRTYPKTECDSCSNHTYCIGGCPLQWMIFDPTKIKNEGSSLIPESHLTNSSINE
jgi:radical SAM protein with 4Fe4S-binding SPASM domain